MDTRANPSSGRPYRHAIVCFTDSEDDYGVYESEPDDAGTTAGQNGSSLHTSYENTHTVPIYSFSTTPRSPGVPPKERLPDHIEPKLKYKMYRTKFVDITDSEAEDTPSKSPLYGGTRTGHTFNATSPTSPRLQQNSENVSRNKTYKRHFVYITDSEADDEAPKQGPKPSPTVSQKTFPRDPISSYSSIRCEPVFEHDRYNNGFHNNPHIIFSEHLEDDAGMSTVANAGSTLSYAQPVHPERRNFTGVEENPMELDNDPFSYMQGLNKPTNGKHDPFQYMEPQYDSRYPNGDSMGSGYFQAPATEPSNQSPNPRTFNGDRMRTPKRGNTAGNRGPPRPSPKPNLSSYPTYPPPHNPPAPVPSPHPPQGGYRPHSKSFSQTATHPTYRPTSADYAYPPSAPSPSGWQPQFDTRPRDPDGVLLQRPPGPKTGVWRQQPKQPTLEEILLDKLHESGLTKVRGASVRTVVRGLVSCGVLETSIVSDVMFITDYIGYIAKKIREEKKATGRTSSRRLILSVREITHLAAVLQKRETEKQAKPQKTRWRKSYPS
ncbi:hypothetical protein AA313_de0201439 [Arthrobotrys entomopaga]|nr:hypothetical protein AA313_de0201439 [Arthrobotrys entomopaga]